MKEIIAFAKLPLSGLCVNDISGKLNGAWKPHFNTAHYQGDWTVLPLRSPGGDSDKIGPDLMGSKAGYANTAYMSHFPGIEQLVAEMQCEIKSVRLLNLKQGGVIKQHRDLELAFELGEARLHFPLQTNDAVEFYVKEVRVKMQVGECWYINANFPHRVANYGQADRIHLVMDCVANDWLRHVFDLAEKTIHQEKEDPELIRNMIAALRRHGNSNTDRMASELEDKLAIMNNELKAGR